MSQTSTHAPRGPLGLLRDPVFGRYFSGKLVSAAGVWVQNIAAAIVMWDLTGSAVMVGAVSVTQFAGPLLLAPLTGTLTDIVDRRRLLMGSRMLSGAAAASVAVAAVLGVLTPLVLLVAIGVMGVGYAMSSPSMQALVPALVPPQDLDQAIALNSVTGNLARAGGPALGAGIIVLGGPAMAFGLSALAHWTFVVLLIGLVPPTTLGGKGRGRILDGFRYLRQNPQMALLLVGVAALGFGTDPVVTLTPALAEQFGRGDGAVGVMGSVFGGGALLAAGVLRPLRQRFSLRVLGMAGFLALALGLLLIAASPVFEAALFGFAVTGSGFLMGTTALTTRIQRRVPDEIRGRVMALWTLAFLGCRPLAAGVNGLLADLVSVQAALVFGAAVGIGAIFLARVSFEARRS
jgi:MFS family permease